MTNGTGRARNPRPPNRGDDDTFLLGEHGNWDEWLEARSEDKTG
jgi:hypothetical protein